MKYVLYAILAYILYQFIFKLVIPVYIATRKIKKGFREMQSKMQEHPFDFAQENQQQPGHTPQPTPSNAEPKTKAGDYIDFEEVK
jgi:hypothetical protein